MDWLSQPCCVCVCVQMHVSTCMCVCTHVCACVNMSVGHRTTSVVSLQLQVLLKHCPSLKHSFSLTWVSLIKQDWPVSLQDSLVSILPLQKFQTYATTWTPFTWVLGSNSSPQAQKTGTLQIHPSVVQVFCYCISKMCCALGTLHLNCVPFTDILCMIADFGAPFILE